MGAEPKPGAGDRQGRERAGAHHDASAQSALLIKIVKEKHHLRRTSRCRMRPPEGRG